MARTKGSKNGISRTKGYTAVGQKAKGRWVNGRYVYDYGSQNNWQQMAAKSAAAGVRNAMVTTNAANAKKKNYQDTIAKGAAMGDAAKAADAQRKAEAKARWQAGNKAMAANKAKEQGAKNNWQQQANETASNRMLYSKWKQGAVNATTSRSHMTPNGDYNPWVADAAKGSSRYMKRNEATNKAKEQGSKNNWQQQAALEQWKQQNRSNIAAKKKAEATKGSVANASKAGEKNNWQDKAESSRQKSELYNKMIEKRTKGITGINKKTGDTEVHTMGVNPKNNMLYYNPVKITKKGGATTGAQNNWQQRAAREAAGTESRNKIANDSTKANKTKGANAMRNDPRYSGSFKTYIKQSDRIPYSSQMEKATNKQELAKAVSKNKQFINDMKNSALRNSRSDIGNALADAKEDAKKAWKKLFSKKKKKK